MYNGHKTHAISDRNVYNSLEAEIHEKLSLAELKNVIEGGRGGLCVGRGKEVLIALREWQSE
jgi:hypothetical protein